MTTYNHRNNELLGYWLECIISKIRAVPIVSGRRRAIQRTSQGVYLHVPEYIYVQLKPVLSTIAVVISVDIELRSSYLTPGNCVELVFNRKDLHKKNTDLSAFCK